MRINKNYLSRFTANKTEYLYKVENGIYLAFNKQTLEYIGVEMFYLPYKSVDSKCEEVLSNLIARGIIEM